ncbi:MAG TPA: gamma-glutamylcyclotransferase family protein [Terriglobia bacterium]|nr:gamma-glutamylcyclotransferase family protein [Terriglobia bacterium]
MIPTPDLLFVYGSLRRGFELHGVLAGLGARHVGNASLRGRLFDLGHYCGAKPSNAAADRVHGEVYRLANPERALGILDRTEGLRPGAPAESFYRREAAEVTLENGATTQAWIYWLARWPGPKRLIASGDYAEH